MTTAHSQIAAAIETTLKASGVAEGRVYRSRVRTITADTPHAVIVRLGRSASLLASVLGGPTGWRTLIQIECYGRMVGGTPDDASDLIVEAVFAALGANPTLGNLAMSVEPLGGDTLSWDFDELDVSLACITARFIVSHQTKGRTLTV
jgi:hypothetical protein